MLKSGAAGSTAWRQRIVLAAAQHKRSATKSTKQNGKRMASRRVAASLHRLLPFVKTRLVAASGREARQNACAVKRAGQRHGIMALRGRRQVNIGWREMTAKSGVALSSPRATTLAKVA